MAVTSIKRVRALPDWHQLYEGAPGSSLNSKGKKIAQQYRINETHSVELKKINRIFMFLFQIKYKTPLRTEPGS